MARTTTDLNQVLGNLYDICAMSVCNLACLMKEQISLKSNKVSSKSTERFRRNCMDRRTDGQGDSYIPPKRCLRGVKK